MKVIDILFQDCVESDVSLSSKKAVLDHLSELLTPSDSDLTSLNILDGLLARERLGSTGLGNGIAIPHARLSGISKTTAAFLKLSKGVDFDAVDSQFVDMFFVLLVPEAATEEHLNVLALLAEMFSDKSFVDQLRNQNDQKMIWAMLTEGMT